MPRKTKSTSITENCPATLQSARRPKSVRSSPDLPHTSRSLIPQPRGGTHSHARIVCSHPGPYTTGNIRSRRRGDNRAGPKPKHTSGPASPAKWARVAINIGLARRVYLRPHAAGGLSSPDGNNIIRCDTHSCAGPDRNCPQFAERAPGLTRALQRSGGSSAFGASCRPPQPFGGARPSNLRSVFARPDAS